MPKATPPKTILRIVLAQCAQFITSRAIHTIGSKLQRQRPSPMVIKETANYDIQITHRAQPATTPYVQQIKNRREWSLCLWSSPSKHWTCVAKLHTPLRSEDWDLANQWHSCPKIVRDQTGADLYHGLHRSIGSHDLITNLQVERRRRRSRTLLDINLLSANHSKVDILSWKLPPSVIKRGTTAKMSPSCKNASTICTLLRGRPDII